MIKKINWRYAIGEIVLIFLGITLAIAFQNWNENRKQAKIEIAVLKQLKIGLQNDLDDVNANIATHERAKQSCQNILQFLISTDSIDGKMIIAEMGSATDYTFLVSDISTYEYLKSVGLHIIQTDSLRRQTTRLYDVVYEGVYGVEKNAKPIQRDLINDFKKYFTSDGETFVSIGNIEEAKKDDALKFDLENLEYSHSSMIRRYEQKIKPELVKLIQMVDNELANK